MTATVFTKDGREKKSILPEDGHHYIRSNGVCSVFSLEGHQNMRELVLRSPVPVNIYLHGKNQFYSRELRTYTSFNGKQSYVVTVKKIKNLETPGAPCSKGEVTSNMI